MALSLGSLGQGYPSVVNRARSFCFLKELGSKYPPSTIDVEASQLLVFPDNFASHPAPPSAQNERGMLRALHMRISDSVDKLRPPSNDSKSLSFARFPPNHLLATEAEYRFSWHQPALASHSLDKCDPSIASARLYTPDKPVPPTLDLKGTGFFVCELQLLNHHLGAREVQIPQLVSLNQ